MATQIELFEPGDAPAPTRDLPQGFRYETGLIDAGNEHALVDALRTLPFRAFEFHGYTGKRRVVSFGWQYDFGTGALHAAADIPAFLLPLRVRAARFAGIPPHALQQALVTEYSPGAAIGWHRDKAVFGEVVGVSLCAPCVFRFRRRVREASWARARIVVASRSVYLLSGEARWVWEHSIAPVTALRYAITFRSLRGS